MKTSARLRTLLLSLGIAALTVFGLGGSIAVGWHAPAARYLAAECRGFDALATVGGQTSDCVPQAAESPKSDAADAPARAGVGQPANGRVPVAGALFWHARKIFSL